MTLTSRILASAVVFLAITISVTPVLAGTTSTPEPTVIEACTSSWNNSSAKNSCSNVKLTKVLNWRCNVTADCQNNSGGTTRTWKTVERNDANRLVNCNGWLKLDNC